MLPGLIAADFIGVSANCAESYTALHAFDVFVDPGEARTATLTIASVPEPAGWVLLVAGFGLTGAALRRSSRAPPAAP